MKKFVSQIFTGGIFFIIPFVIVIIVFEKLIQILKPISAKLGALLSIEHYLLDVPYFFSILLIILICFIAGLIAKLGVGKRMVNWIESNILTLFPGYQLIKNTYETKLGLDQSENFPVVLAPIDGWMFAFLVEELDEKHSLVFVPSSPDSWSGNMVIFEKSKLKKTSLQKADLIKMNRRLGIDSMGVLEGKIDLS
ncbi:DUF502 domain-containing protein [Algoriphagus limi]|uniref:DUF502 domain-containing protein n=1 Tax=Algoriphagus limi TaxID=2975273 RepID=A0ABT2G2S3_9BACT|nr:DUF502 domain-containing protein [Algoriphagus limi]MCS5489564.1 DUF502 domain-containing protein [Algoriphagus limi]